MSCSRRNERYLELNRAPSSPRGMTMLSRSRIIFNFVFSMLGDRSIRKRPFARCVKKQALTSPTPECAEWNLTIIRQTRFYWNEATLTFEALSRRKLRFPLAKRGVQASWGPEVR
jgi:hypothetical protein